MAEFKKNTGIMSKEEVTCILENIGKMIQEERNSKHWSMADLAKKSGISSSLISDLENNKGKVPNICTLISIARALNLSDDEFIKGFWKRSKTVHRQNLHGNRESEVKKVLLDYGVPQKALSGIMNYVNMLVILNDMYDLTNGVVNDETRTKELLSKKGDELRKYISDLL